MADLDETLDDQDETLDGKDDFESWLAEREAAAEDEPIDEQAHRDAVEEEDGIMDDGEVVESADEQLAEGTDYTEVSDDEWAALLKARTPDAPEPTEADLRAEFEAHKAQQERDALAKEFRDFMAEQAEASREAVRRLTPDAGDTPSDGDEPVYGDLSQMSEAEIHALVRERLDADMSYAELANRGVNLADAPVLRSSEVIEERQDLVSEYSTMSGDEFAKVLAQRDRERTGEGSPF